NGHHHQESDAQPELFADQVAEPFARHCTHARRNLLDHDQGDGDGNQRPQQVMPIFRAGKRIREDAIGIIVNIRGDEARTDYCEYQQDPGLPASQELHGHISKTWEEPTTRQNKCGHKIWIGQMFEWHSGFDSAQSFWKNDDYSFSRRRLITSSEVMTPVSVLRSSITGNV